MKNKEAKEGGQKGKAERKKKYKGRMIKKVSKENVN